MFQRYIKIFDHEVRLWASTACREWDFPEPSEEFFEKLSARLPAGLCATIGFGIDEGIVVPNGFTFRIKGLPQTKGPYKWFSKNNAKRISRPNWEWFIHVAEYIRLCQAFKNSDYVLKFEYKHMDIGLYKNNELLVCCEIKVKSTQAENLILGIKAYEKGIDLTTPDRGNDSLRKAKYIIHQRPLFFYLVAIGARYEFSVSFPEGKAFELKEDIIPFI
ncbi:MAG: hypothetical protein NT009_08290 [Proteobacteria bacterium]|nr:hypothetical protein [Pseudomonadota bacterium]